MRFDFTGPELSIVSRSIPTVKDICIHGYQKLSTRALLQRSDIFLVSFPYRF
jgi:hypothetical protein